MSPPLPKTGLGFGKVEGHIAFGLCVCVCVCVRTYVRASVTLLNGAARVLKFHTHVPHEKTVDTYFLFSYPSYAPFLSYVPLKTKFENLVCKISEEVFVLEPSYLAYCLGLKSKSPD